MKCPKCSKELTTIIVEQQEIYNVEYQLIDGELDEVKREDIDSGTQEWIAIVCPHCFEVIEDGNSPGSFSTERINQLLTPEVI